MNLRKLLNYKLIIISRYFLKFKLGVTYICQSNAPVILLNQKYSERVTSI